MKEKKNLWSVLWVIEFAVGLAPATAFLYLGGILYAALFTTLPKLLSHPEPAALKDFFRMTVIVVGGGLGLISIVMAFQPHRLRRRAQLKIVALVFGCAGVLAEALYVQSVGFWVAWNPGMMWILLGPVVVGAHCAYRVFLQRRT